MRLLVDFQSLQGRWMGPHGSGQFTMEIASALAQHPEVSELIALFNGDVSSRNLLAARLQVQELIPGATLAVFDAPWTRNGSTGARREAGHNGAEYVRDAVIRDLSPDVILIGSPLEAPLSAVVSIPATGGPFTAVMVHSIPTLRAEGSQSPPRSEMVMRARHVRSLRTADLIVARSARVAGQVRQLLADEMPPILTMDGVVEAPPSHPNAGALPRALRAESDDRPSTSGDDHPPHWGAERVLDRIRAEIAERRVNASVRTSLQSLTAKVLLADGVRAAQASVAPVIAALSEAYDVDVVELGSGTPTTSVVQADSAADRVVVLLDSLGQAAGLTELLGHLRPSVVIACDPDGLEQSHAQADPQYLFEARGLRSGQPDLSESLGPLAQRCLGVFVVGREGTPRRPGGRLGRVNMVRRPDELAGAMEELVAALPVSPLPAGLSPRSAAIAVARHRRRPHSSVFFDVTLLRASTVRTGIQRVSLALARNLARTSARPVFPVGDCDGYLAVDTSIIPELVPKGSDVLAPLADPGRIAPAPGDLLLVTEISDDVESWEPIVADWRARGGEYVQVVYDLLPIRLEDFFVGYRGRFERWLSMVCRWASTIVCDSEFVAADLADWLRENPPDRRDSPQVTWMRLGYDLNESAPFPTALRARSRGQRTVLVVGTIEPRKGVDVVLDAAEELWRRGEDVEFVFVGRPGWALPEVLGRLAALDRSNRPVRWLREASDEDLRLQYLSADLLVMASRGEGFGLPIVEALAHGVPVVARDIPVFRELLGEQDCYFRLDRDLPDAILRRLRSREPIAYAPGRLVTWEQAALDLLDAVGLQSRRDVV